MSAADFPIRPEWMYEVRSACQKFQCAVWLTERTQFERALRSLVASVPAAMSVQEAAALKELLMTGVVDAARLFHSYSHELSPPRRCRASPVESVQHVWSEWHEDPRLTLACWVERFLAVYDATHPPSPAERAAAILRDRFRSPPDLGPLAREVGSSRSALTRNFKKRYGMSCGEYLTRVRIRWFIDEVRQPGSKAGRLAAEAGYRRYHNLLDALDLRTGCAPCDVRCRTDNHVRELLDGRLSLFPCRSAKMLVKLKVFSIRGIRVIRGLRSSA